MRPDPFHPGEEDSVSPVRSFCSTTIPLPSLYRHTAVIQQHFERLTSEPLKETISALPERSQTRKFAPSPLDTIPSNVYARFPRFSTATENSTPVLSTEEVTSTRLSIDEHDIIRLPHSTTTFTKADGKRQQLNTALHKAISIPSLSLRRVRDRLRRGASSTLSGNTLRHEATSTVGERSQACSSLSRASSNTPTATATQCNTDQDSGIDTASAPSFTHKSLGSSKQQENGILHFKRSSKEFLTRTYPRLSTLIERKAENESSVYQSRQKRLLDEALERSQRLSSGALKAFDDSMDPSFTFSNSYHTAPDHFSPQASSFFARPTWAVPDYGWLGSNSSGRMLSGSIDELRSTSFSAMTRREFSFSSTPPEASSQVNLERRPSRAPVARPVTLHDVEDVRSLNQLRQDPLFVDMPNGHQTNFIFPPLAQERSAPVVPHSRRNSKTRSYRNFRSNETLPLLLRSSSMKEALERGNYQQKVPLYTPSQIVGPRGTPLSFPRRVSSLAQADAGLQAWDGMSDEIVKPPDQSSKNSQSNASEWSTKENRAHCQDPDHPSLRSEDPSVKSGDLGPWGKGQRFLANVIRAIPRRPVLEKINGSRVLSEADTEKDNCREPFKRTCGFYARRIKQKLRGTRLQDAVEKG